MYENLRRFACRAGWLCLASLAVHTALTPVAAAPSGATVTQGTATFNSQGSQLTITTSDRATINWQSFNIGRGETTTFVQPSSSSVVWNQINDPNPSQILGHLNANGYVVLQNTAGFYIGGDATISTHGLLMTTAPFRAPDLAGGGAWQFSAPPPTASIINYGQINVGKGGAAFLIAHDVENHGGINAPGGQIGLYAGKEVLISERPDGRGLSARVTLPEGSVDNSGRLTASAGTILLQAQVVNQGGLIEANSIREHDGVIELVASDSLHLGENSVIQASGAGQGASPGGNVLLKSGGQFSDENGSKVIVSGGTQGGNGGQVEISAPRISSIQSSIEGHAARGFLGGKLVIDPENIVLAGYGDDPPGSGTVNPGDPPSAGSPDTLTLNVNSFNTLITQNGLSQISLQATRDIEVATAWSLPDTDILNSALTLRAGRNITLDDGAAILGGRNWSVNLFAGTELTSASARQPGLDGIYLNGNSFIQTLNGNIKLWAGNEVIVNPGPPYDASTGDPGNNGVRTTGGGSIDVTALYGDVNTGGNYQGFVFGTSRAPYYRVSPNLGGISTAAGGDVTITAGGNVTSYLPVQDDYNSGIYDGGSGAFGSQPGNVTISAGGNISGHYVLANGVGTITGGGDIGASTAAGGFALSLIKGNWTVSAPNGSIYLQDIRNPNGLFNDKGSVDAYAGYHQFNYDPWASLSLNAGNAVEITGAGAPHLFLSSGEPVPFLFPPSLAINAGPGGITLDTDVTLFPSPHGELRLTTTGGGNFQSQPNPADPQDVIVRTLAMSDSAAVQWDPAPADGVFGTFSWRDHAATPPELDNRNPVEITVSGSMNNVNLRTTKETQINVAGDMLNVGFLGQNLHADDVTSVNVAGQIHYSPIYAFTSLGQGITSVDPQNPAAWDSIFSYLVDPTAVASFQVPAGATPAQLLSYAETLKLALSGSRSSGYSYDSGANPGFIYDATSHQLGFKFRMSDAIRNALEGPLEVIKLDAFGVPQVQLGQASLGQDPTKYYFVTTSVNFAPASAIENLYQQSLSSVKTQDRLSPGFQIGGPGQFNVTAASIDLGSSSGILSWGIGSANNPIDYSSLASVTPVGAAVKVTTTSGDLRMLTSTIASIDGGDVEVNSAGAVNLSLGDFALIPPNPAAVSYGIFTSGHSDVRVTAEGDINVGGARIGTFNGGNVYVKSLDGDVNAGNGANSTLVIPVIYRDPGTGALLSGTIANPRPFGSGILAMSPTAEWQAPGASSLPGNITIETPRGSIISTLGGIQQIALNGSAAGGPTITLTAGTPASDGSPAIPGNVDLGNGGVVGGTINISAQGNISGLIVSRQNSNIQAAQGFSGTLLAGGTASISASGGGISGTVIGIGGVSASGGGPITASLLGQNVSVGGGAAQSTLGNSTAPTAASQAAAGQASADAEKKVAMSDTPSTDDDEKKKRGAKLPTLAKRVGRVTVILPAR